MKNLIAVFVFMAIVLPAMGQNRYRGTVEGQYSALLDTKSGHSFQITTVHGAKVGSFFIGGGIGLEIDEIVNGEYSSNAHYQGVPYMKEKMVQTISVPVFLDIHSMWDKHTVSPMAGLRVGTSFGEVVYDDVFGPFVEPAFGVRYQYDKSQALSAALFGKLLYDPGILSDHPECQDGWFEQLGIRLSYEF